MIAKCVIPVAIASWDGAEDAPLRMTLGLRAVAEKGGMMQLQRWCINALLLGLMAVAAGATGARAASDNPLAAQPLELLSDTRQRPLFAPTRRPPPPLPPPVVQRVEPPAPVPPPNVILLGVVTDENGARAVVRSASPDKIVRARLGEEIEGWQVTQIEPRRLVLSHDARSVSFELFSRSKESVLRDAAPTAAEVELRNMAQERFGRRTGQH
jgi:general secretion pathway protein N